jgi:hypothetical protein
VWSFNGLARGERWNGQRGGKGILIAKRNRIRRPVCRLISGERYDSMTANYQKYLVSVRTFDGEQETTSIFWQFIFWLTRSEWYAMI